MKILTPLFCFLTSALLFGQSTYDQMLSDHRAGIHADFLDPDKSPLDKKARKKFEGIAYYPTQQDLVVEARIERMAEFMAATLKTTDGKMPVFERYAFLHFTLRGKTYRLSVFRNPGQPNENYLFLPFTDLTTGKETYGGGRYMDLQNPEGDRLSLDFNKAYTPLCAYNPAFVCTIPPAENRLPIAIEAGAKFIE